MLVLAACGGDGEQQGSETTPGPRIEAAVAQPLAERSENVARLLDRNDPCGAGAEAQMLRDEVTAAINAGQIPPDYLEDLSGVVNEIQAQIPPCEPAPEPPPPTETDGGGKGGDGDD